MWQMVFNMKAEGKTNEEIINSLVENNIERDIATDLIGKLPAIAEDFYNNARKKMMYSFVFIFIGLLMILGWLNMRLSPTTGMIGGMLAAAALRFFPVNNKMYRLSEKAMRRIEEEQTPTEEKITNDK